MNITASGALSKRRLKEVKKIQDREIYNNKLRKELQEKLKTVAS